MAKYKLHIKAPAAKELESLCTKEIRGKIIVRIHALAIQPRPVGCQKLHGKPALYRIRQGKYRVVYSIDEAAKVVTIFSIDHRKDTYRP